MAKPALNAGDDVAPDRLAIPLERIDATVRLFRRLMPTAPEIGVRWRVLTLATELGLLPPPSAERALLEDVILHRRIE